MIAATWTFSAMTDDRLQTFLARNRSMEFLKELRKDDRVVKQKSEIRLALSIPPVDYEILKIKYPVLQFGSPYEKKQFWNRFYNSSESAPYKVSA